VKPLIRFAQAIDWLNEKFAWLAAVAVLMSCLISAGNAIIRHGFSISSNAWLEIQWYLFAYTVMFGTSYVLKMNEHVRVDLLYNRLKGNGRVYLDLFGLVFFVMPFVVLMFYLSYPEFTKMLASGERSSNAGGLIRWPAMLALGFALLGLQVVSEVIKRVGHISGSFVMDTHYDRPLQ
jgi:TRAP-type mannitol/chloroaromatic compound transport system permease small subunit